MQRFATCATVAIFGILAMGLATALEGCRLRELPSSARIEAVAMEAAQRGDAAAEHSLRDWAAQLSPVAERELGLLLRARPAAQDEAMQLFSRAGNGGDGEAAYQLGDMLRARTSPLAAPWYRRAALLGHAKAALMLALLYKNGELVAQDDAAAAQWLTLSARRGNAHAMFLLSNAYAAGQGVARDAAHARALLEDAAEHEYPPAQQELALATQSGDAYTAKDALRASHLLKEAAEHRHNNAGRF